MVNKQQTPEKKETKKKTANKSPVTDEAVKKETKEDTLCQEVTENCNDTSARTEIQASGFTDTDSAKDRTKQVPRANDKQNAAQQAGTENAELKAKGLQILSGYPKEQKVYMTVNGLGFFKYTDACNHAETLSNKTILTINRE